MCTLHVHGQLPGGGTGAGARVYYRDGALA
jgi:hypothetical protein